jgi:hypothetical protein
MTHYATIDLSSGYIWWVGKASTPEQACSISTAEPGGDAGVIYERISASERGNGSGYAVHEVPADFVCDNGQDAEQISAVKAMPLAGYYNVAATE